MAPLKMLSIMVLLTAGCQFCQGTPTTVITTYAEIKQQPMQNYENTPSKSVVKDPEISHEKEAQETKDVAVNLPPVLSSSRPRARGMTPLMEMLDQKRHPKPKRPMGNDIGTARGMDNSVHRFPNGYPMDYASQPRTADHLEATVSVGFTMSTVNNTKPARDEESLAVSRELHQMMESLPVIPELYKPNSPIRRDPEEEAINERITQVARQLAESSLRKEYEIGHLGGILPKEEHAESTTSVNKELAATTTKKLAEAEVTAPTAVELKEPKKPVKVGKSFIVGGTLPLVSHMPQEAAQLQLIAEVQQVPHYMIHEGFHPRTPAPELSGPLLGGPPLKPEDTEEGEDQRTSKSIDVTKSDPAGPASPYLAMRLPAFLKLVSPKYGFKPNDLVVSIPANGGYLPAIVSGAGAW